MGLLTGLLTLPLAPVRGTVWIADRLREQAERERDGTVAVRRELADLEIRHDLGEIDDDEYGRREEALLDALAEATADADELGAS